MYLPTFCILVQLPYLDGTRISALVESLGTVIRNLDHGTETHDQISVVFKLK